VDFWMSFLVVSFIGKQDDWLNSKTGYSEKANRAEQNDRPGLL